MPIIITIPNLARSCANYRLALQRKSGPRIALPAHRLYYPVDIWPRSTTRGAFVAISEVLRDHTARARMQQQPPSATASVSSCVVCRLVLCGSSAGQSRRKKAVPHPGREPRGCMHADGEQRGHLAAPGRQTKWGGCREGPLASDIDSFSYGQAAQTLGRAQDFIAYGSNRGALHSNFQQRQSY
jgi:hypothetical protein